MDNNDMNTNDEMDADDVDEAYAFDDIPSSGDAHKSDDAPIDDAKSYESVAPAPVPHQQGLVRDPYATFGGVISGIAHRYGWDVALTRLGFLATVFLTGGSALLLYLLAWLIVPRATYWPPNGRTRSRGLSARELGFGLAAAGVLIYLAVGTGGLGQAVVPLALVGGGVWLLMQNPRAESVAEVEPAPFAMAGGAPPFVDSYPAAGSAVPPPPIGRPVPPRKRRRGWIVGVVILVLGALVALIIGIGALVFSAANGDIDFNSSNSIRRTPASPSDLPIEINEDAAEVRIDLTNLSSADFDGVSTPAVVDVRVDVGSVRVILPADLAVNVDAEVSIGSVILDGQEDSGFGSQRRLSDVDPDVDIEIDLGVGEVVVERLSESQTSIDRS